MMNEPILIVEPRACIHPELNSYLHYLIREGDDRRLVIQHKDFPRVDRRWISPPAHPDAFFQAAADLKDQVLAAIRADSESQSTDHRG